MQKFTEWLETQLAERGWQAADLARASGLPDATISRVLNGTRGVGPKVCRQIARALKLPEDVLFQRAGLQSARPEADALMSELLYHFDRLTEEDQELAIALVSAMAKQRERDTEIDLPGRRSEGLATG